MHTFHADLRLALRNLAARPLFAVAAIATLALGVGANVAVLSLFRQVLVQELPVPEPGQLLNLTVEGREGLRLSSSGTGGMDSVLSYPLFQELEQAAGDAGQVAGHRLLPVNLALAGRSEHATALLVSGGYFDALGLRATLGRLISSGDDRVPGQAQAAVLGHRYWRDVLGSDPAVLGQSIRINGQSLEIVGIGPAGFGSTTLGANPAVYLPLSLPAPQGGMLPSHDARDFHWLYAFARPASGQHALALQARLDAALQTAMADDADFNREGAPPQHIVLVPGARGQSLAPADARKPLALAQGVALLVLAIACVNLANLQLARGIGRGGEMAVRAAIGASRRRLLVQALAEPVLMAFAGALVAWPVAWGVVHLLSVFLSVGDMAISIDPLAAVAAFAVAWIALLGFGLYPAWHLARSAPMTAIKNQGANGAGRSAPRLRAVLATVQVAFSMALLGVAGLFVQSLANLERTDLGIATDSLTVFTVEPGRNGYDETRSRVLFSRIEEELAALPGALSVSQSAIRLLDGSIMGAPAKAGDPDADGRMISYNAVGSGFLTTVGAPLLAGREFTTDDRAGTAKVALVDRRFVEAFELGENPIGQQVRLMGEGTLEIIGVVGEMTYHSARNTSRPQLFLPHAQFQFTGDATFYLRSAMPPAQMRETVMRTLAGIDPDLPVLELRTMREQLRDSIASERTIGALSSVLAVLATVLAAGGLYSVLSYAVAQRTRELGLRLALGAAPARLRRLVMSQVVRIGVVGAALGLAGALAAGHAARSQLFGLSAHDPAVLGIAVALLCAVVVLAGWMPALRASRTDPMTALRHEG